VAEENTQKIEAVQRVLQKHFSNSSAESIYLSFRTLAEESLLRDEMGVKKIFSVLEKDSNGEISFEVVMGRIRLPDRAGQSGVYPELSDPYPAGLRVHVSNPTKLNEYFKDILFQLEKKGAKLNFNFSPGTGIMIIEEQNGNKYEIKVQGQVQKEVLRVIFSDPACIYDEWSLYDISEILGSHDVDEKAVKNAVYQFDKKVKLAMPNIKSIFKLTKNSTRLNPVYKK